MLSRLVIFFAIAAAVLFAQQPAGQQPPQSNIRVSVNEVIVPVTVTDEKNRFVSDLDEKDFQIFDEGREQKISYFSREGKQPVVVGFLLDLSNQSRLHWKTYQEAARELVWNLLPGDKKYSGYLVGYHTEAELMVNTTSDSDKITDRIAKLKPSGGAALFDSIYMACTQRSLIKGEPIEPRRILIIIGDGHDNASKKTMDEVLELAQRNLVTIYGVSTVAFGFSSDGEKILEKLALETGGRVLYPLQGLYKDVSGYLSTPSDEGNYALKVGTGGYAAEIASGIFRSIAAVAGEITTQYIMRYIPDSNDQDKVFRKLEVRIPKLPLVKIRARTGYYPAAP
jgi:VWFA-related protein